MPSTYTLNNGIELIGTGEQSGTWGDTTNTNLGLLDAALDGQVTITLAAAGSSGSPNALPITDGTASNGRNRMVVFSDSGDLGATAYVQLTPNDAEKIIYIRNSLSGSRSVILFQGTYNASNDYEVPAGTTAVVYFDGAGAGAVAANVFNNAYFDGLRLGSVSVTAILDEDNMASDSAAALATQQSIKAYVDSQVGTVDTLAEILAIGNTTGATDIAVDSAQKVQFRDAAIYINSSVDGQLDIVADTEIQIAATTVDVNGALDVSGTALVTGVLTTTAATVSNGGGQFNGAINVGVDDTGYDVKFFGATAGAYMLWDESADDLILGGAAGLSVNSTALVTGVLTTTAATVFNGGFTANADSTLGTDKKVQFRDAAIYINSSVDGQLDIVADTEIQIAATTVDLNGNLDVSGTLGVTGVLTATSLDISGDIDVDGTTNLDIVDIDGAVDMASTLLVTGVLTTTAATVSNGGGQFNGAINVGVDDTGYDVKFFGATTGKSLLWDESADSLTVAGNLSVDGGTIKLDGNYPVGTNNVALGDAALNGSLTGSENVAVGTYSLDALTSGAYNSGLGYGTLSSTTTGSNNSAVGNGSLISNTSGSYNAALGVGALLSNTTADNNTAVGYQAGYSLTTASYNVAIGYRALYSNTTSYGENVAIGDSALYNTTDGWENIAIGRGAGESNTTGVRNTFIGDGAGNFCTTADNNTIIGRFTGNNGGLDIRTSSNNIVLSDGDGNPRVIVDSSGNLLVGSTTTGSASAGHTLYSTGQVTHTMDDTTIMFLNRTTSDGTLLEFRKDDSTVGSIGTLSSRLHIENGDTGLRIAGDLDQIFPCGSGGGDRDAAIDLGSTGVRFKDLYLSGGVYLGGTGAANHLDDYEEGTWNCAVLGQVATSLGRYVKIGELVYVEVRFVCDTDVTTTNDGAIVGGFPFSASSTTRAVLNLWATNLDAVAGYDGAPTISSSIGPQYVVLSGTTNGVLRPQSSTSSNPYYAENVFGSTSAFYVTGSYRIA
jgi:hypothetical protein